ncbi:hypothetical protein D8682_00695 (plasmid) [Buttiauxella sp. 3AFRM03]|uniref:hypothetical protein n=1 Tax=Buttiauxella sp. 3AFRM03 TaxID=2479367 RepID=UPI000EF82829|nr:hypothetical protein [Buttiauxella sp. 3AFRM03]AYN25518.1 hypothetical protein D8682_00075 [Buttiauxella sp. 3AFRM03]AYN25627.1 hypothetical protein D8682_00695 [Buttiauxella sp. 3AFRM03]
MHYFYIPGSYSVLEPVQVDGNQNRGMNSGETLEQLQIQNTQIVMLHMDDCITAIRAAARMPVEVISKSTFDLFRRSKIMDECQSNLGCSFKCREFNAADIVTCFAALVMNDQPIYATFRDVDSLTHDEILSRARETVETTLTANQNVHF